MLWNENELKRRLQDNITEDIQRQRVFIDAILAMCKMGKCKPSCPFFSIKVQKKSCTPDEISDFVRKEAKRRHDEKISRMNRGAVIR